MKNYCTQNNGNDCQNKRIASNTKFDARTTTDVLQKLDEAIKILNYSDRSDWFRAMYRETVEKAENKKGEIKMREV